MAEDNENVNDQTTRSTRDLRNAIQGLAGVFIEGRPGIANTIGSLGALGETVKPIASFLEKQVEMYMTLSKSGVNFGADIGEMTLAARGAGLELKQFQEIAAANAEMFAGIGPTANAGAGEFFNRLNSLGREIDTVSGQGTTFRETLRRLGQDYEDIAETQSLLMQSEAMSMHRNTMTDAQRNEATLRFSKELDVLSKLTGKQQDEIKKDLAKRMREGQVRAYLMGLDKEQADQVKLALAEADARGYGDLARDILVKGFPAEDQRRTAGLMGDTVQELLNLRGNIQSGNIDAARANRISVTAAATNETRNMRDLAILQGVTSFGDAAAAVYERMSLGQFYAMRAIEQEEARLGRRLTQAEREAITLEQEQKARDEQANQIRNQGDNIAQAVISLQEGLVTSQAEIQASAINTAYREVLGPALNRVATGFDNLDVPGRIQSFFDTMRGFAPSDSQGGTDPIVTAIQQLAPLDPSRADLLSTYRDIQSMEEGSEKDTRMEQFMNDLNAARREANLSEVNLDGATVTAENAKFNITGAAELFFDGRTLQLNEGTVGATGSLLHDFGKQSMAILHGREAVLNENQLTNLTQGMYNMGQQMAPNLQGMLNTVQREARSSNVDVQGITQAMSDAMGRLEPAMQNMAKEMRGPMTEMAESLRGPMNQIATDMHKNANTAVKQLRTTRGMGDIFRGIRL